MYTPSLPSSQHVSRFTYLPSRPSSTHLPTHPSSPYMFIDIPLSFVPLYCTCKLAYRLVLLKRTCNLHSNVYLFTAHVSLDTVLSSLNVHVIYIATCTSSSHMLVWVRIVASLFAAQCNFTYHFATLYLSLIHI